MKASEIFGIVIRVIGLIITLIGIYDIYRAFIMFVQVQSIGSLSPLLFGVPSFLLGIWLLGGAPWLMLFSYPEQKKESNN